MLVFIFIKQYDFWIKHGINNIVEPNIVWFSISSHCISEFSPIPFPSFLLRTMIFLFHIAWFSICSQHFMENTQVWWFFSPRFLQKNPWSLRWTPRYWTSWRATSRSCPCRAICRSWPTPSPPGTWAKVVPAKGKDGFWIRCGTVPEVLEPTFFLAGESTWNMENDKKC